MKKKTTKNKIVTIQEDGSMRTPMVVESRILFNLCCLGLVRIGTEEEDESFNGRLLLETGNMFFEKGYTAVFVHQSLTVTGSRDIYVYFRFKANDQLSSKHYFDEEEDWFCISILNDRSRGGRYVRFRRNKGEVYYSDKVKESEYKPGTFCHIGSDNIERPLTNAEFEKMKKDIDITLNHRNEWW